jgi:hypothetical protein
MSVVETSALALVETKVFMTAALQLVFLRQEIGKADTLKNHPHLFSLPQFFRYQD